MVLDAEVVYQKVKYPVEREVAASTKGIAEYLKRKIA
jgi:hypothetical protein